MRKMSVSLRSYDDSYDKVPASNFSILEYFWDIYAMCKQKQDFYY